MVNKINQDFVGMRWLEKGGGQSNTSKLRNETFRPLYLFSTIDKVPPPLAGGG